MHVAAALVDDPRSVIENTLYWGTVTSRVEGHYLCEILNSPALTDLVRPLMSYGKDERHVDKHLWKLPIPRYDETDPQHRQLADLGRACAEHVKTLDLDETSIGSLRVRCGTWRWQCDLAHRSVRAVIPAGLIPLGADRDQEPAA